MMILMMVLAYLIIGTALALKKVELIEEVIVESEVINKLSLLQRRIAITTGLILIILTNPINELWWGTRKIWYKIDLFIFKIKWKYFKRG